MTRLPAEVTQLPVAGLLPALTEALATQANVVLVAPPGAGKSTGVPLALLADGRLRGRIILLEPRRLAARAVATRMAKLLGEPLGQTVGIRTRLETRVSAATRLEVVTEGVLTRMLQADAALEGVALVIFDEFHERSLNADLGLALCLDAQANLRDDLRLLVMSATLDAASVAGLLGGDGRDCPVLSSEGRAFPVETRHLGRAQPDSLARDVAAAVRRALTDEPGDLLVFLPGAPEIRRVMRLLAEPAPPAGVHVLPLYGDLTPADQDAALGRAPAGVRKVVLATAIAETSLTIEGVRVVIDCGYARRARFDPVSGMSGLETVRVSRAAADQRRGRAGRLEPGTCYRLWPEEQTRALAAQTPAEILEADLAPLALELACWGVADPGQLRLLDAPPAATFAQARDLLTRLGALDAAGSITAHGRGMARLGLHPRLAHMVLAARPLGLANLAVDIAAVLSERDLFRAGTGLRNADLRLRVEALRREAATPAGLELDRGACERARRLVSQWRRELGLDSREVADVDGAGILLAFAYPDRIGRARGADGRYALSGGRGAFFAEPQALARSEFLVAAELDAGEREARIFLAAPVTLDELERHCAQAIELRDVVRWDAREQAVIARRERRLGAVLLEERRPERPDAARVLAAMLEGIASLGLEAMPWTREARALQRRAGFARSMLDPRDPPWPAVDDETLATTLADWLAPWLDGISRRDHLSRLDLLEILRGHLGYAAQKRIDELAPTHLVVPSGSRLPIDYTDTAAPSVSVRLQEMFGLTETPRVGGGRVPLTIELLSPAQRPVQVTRDLRSFWERGYVEVKKELKGRYPKHYWPDDPLTATPTHRARPRP